MRELVISLVQTINGSYAQDSWSTGVSTEADFDYFISLRKQAGAIIIDRRTALNPALPVINAPGKALAHTPVHVLTESDPAQLSKQLAEVGLDYRAQHFTPGTLTQVLEAIESTSDTLVCESGPNLAYRLLDAYPGAELHLSLSPLYSRNAGSHFSQLEADLNLRLIDVRTADDQVFLRYAKA
ncbi:MAG: hypothetical protein L0I80_10350 [Brevibacterium sp.]|uniref:hypothetical protein n=1 Tax=Brevibacterium sp. TaxID=1701 RepID=UPI002649F662|nr:hypothetical protein [Brevibacterium sp.]MDN6124247.1 hypothetical protein [Brevibacterium sp.]MDN6134965.1 hypothetical protein [Brevibacterium sp.]MDN6158711.1 hypothetical protein [Brevibacterium sp.]MDN6175484.1 hypothetical protein [Brevibacterium sp.]MDN6188857.1 hypothetical protein [Brevibacterium sp.]